MDPTIDRLPYADCAFVEAELRAKERGEQVPLPTPWSPVRPPSIEELHALHFRFWSADRKRFDHIGFAHAVIAMCERDADRAGRGR